MSWFWMNISLGAVFFLAMTLIPLWMVIRHPDARSRGAAGLADIEARRAEVRPVRAPAAAAASRTTMDRTGADWTDSDWTDPDSAGGPDRELVLAGGARR
ncbi:MAG: hypothetical protein ACLP7J_23100 [Streptosporangiaceae bacterium]